MDKAEVTALQEYEDAMELGNEATPASKPWCRMGQPPPSRRGPSSGKHPNIRTSHPLAPALECSDVRLVGQEARERVLELRCLVAVPREIGSLSRMNDDGTNIIVSQQRRDLVFGDWASAELHLSKV
jgi:hypothetical protein